MSLSSIWVLVEPAQETLSSTSLELLTAASRLSDQVEAFGFGLGSDVAGVAGRHGARKVIRVTQLNGVLGGTAIASVMAQRAAEGEMPDAIFFSATTEGRDAAARLSVKLDRPVLTNVVDIIAEQDHLVSQHAIFGGSEIVSARFSAEAPGIFVVRAKSFAPEATDGPAAEVEDVALGDIGPAGNARIVRTNVEEHTGPKLDEASVVVSGGRGLGQVENYAMVEELATILKGAPGASRAIVDAGWVPYSHQVGQTGKTVKPTLYFACGISGATQHVVGMKGAKNIVAINKDADAPIFSISDLGVVGDVHKIMPKLIEALKSRS